MGGGPGTRTGTQRLNASRESSNVGGAWAARPVFLLYPTTCSSVCFLPVYSSTGKCNLNPDQPKPGPSCHTSFGLIRAEEAGVHDGPFFRDTFL